MFAIDLETVLARHLADPASSWSIGGVGAVAEFSWDTDEAGLSWSVAPLARVSDRGGIRLDICAGVHPLCYESLRRDPDRWQHGVAFCLPMELGARPQRKSITELGPDEQALRPEDRSGIVFDLGLDLPHTDACVRTQDPDLLAILRQSCGTDALESDGLAMAAIRSHSPHRVFVSKLGRVEVYQAIPAIVTPTGPHTHILPQLLAERRAHPSDIPIPDGWLACLSLYPPNPVSAEPGDAKPFNRARHKAFQTLLNAWGAPDYVAEKRRVLAALSAAQSAEDFPEPMNRLAHTALLIALRQWAYTHGESPLLAGWRGRFDGLPLADA